MDADTLKKEQCEVHLLPCKIMDNCECKVKGYFSSTIMRSDNLVPENTQNYES